MTQFAIFEGNNIEEVQREVNEWIIDGGEKVIESHSMSIRPDIFNKYGLNITLTVQYHMKG